MATPAWFVSGAKTVKKDGQDFVVVGMQSPNMQNFNQDHTDADTTDTYVDTETANDTNLPSQYWGLLVGASSINSAPFTTGKNARGIGGATTSDGQTTVGYSGDFSMFGYRSLSLWAVMNMSSA